MGSKADDQEDDLLRKRRCTITMNPFSGLSYDEYARISALVWPDERERMHHVDRWLSQGDRAKNLWVSDRQWTLLQGYDGDVFNIQSETGLYDPTDWVVWAGDEYIHAYMAGHCPRCKHHTPINDYGQCSYCGMDNLTRDFNPVSTGPERSESFHVILDRAHESLRNRRSNF